MSEQLTRHMRQPKMLFVLILTQIFCAGFFLIDIVADYVEMGFASLSNWHFYVELIASVSLVIGIVMQVHYLLALLRKQAQLEQNLSMARSAIQEVIDAHFQEWQLTPAEADVANFLIKGMEISEIASLRNSAEGTIKAHLNAIYRKSGTKNRSDLLSTLIESLMGGEKPSSDLG